MQKKGDILREEVCVTKDSNIFPYPVQEEDSMQRIQLCVFRLSIYRTEIICLLLYVAKFELIHYAAAGS